MILAILFQALVYKFTWNWKWWMCFSEARVFTEMQWRHRKKNVKETYYIPNGEMK